MKISELMAELVKLQAEHGADAQVVMENECVEGGHRAVSRVRAVARRSSYAERIHQYMRCEDVRLRGPTVIELD